MKILKASLWLLCFIQWSVYAQETKTAGMFCLQVDNDVFVPKEHDNYYTSGVFLAYQAEAVHFLFWDRPANGTMFWSGSLRHQMFTPVYPSSTYIENYDRPFAGWLAGTLNVSRILKNNGWTYGLEAGVTGEISFAKELQQGFHKLTGIKEKPLWIDQIPSEFMVNLQTSYFHSLNRNLFFEASGVAGTKDVYIQPGLVLLINNTMERYKMPIKENRFYGVLSTDYRLVGYDALIQGSIWKNNAPLTKPVERHMVWAKAGMCWMLNGFMMEFNYTYGTKQTAAAGNHIYGTIKLAVLF